jgi:hypothetical protein
MTDLDSVHAVAAATGFLAVVATARPDGSVHASVVNAGVLDDPVSGVPSVAMVVAGGARKLDYLARSGRGTAVFRNGWAWAAVDGRVRIIGPDGPPPEAAIDLPALLREVFRAAGGTHDDWDTYDRVMAAERRSAVFLSADRILGNV